MNFEVGIQQEFIAQHFLIGGDWGDENTPHSHHFKIEIILKSSELDHHNYVADIAVLKNKLDNVVCHFKDKLLNDLSEFHNENPSIELFSKILWNKIFGNIETPNIKLATIRLWEDDISWATYEKVP